MMWTTYPSVLPQERCPDEDGLHTINTSLASGLGDTEIAGAALAVELGEVTSLDVQSLLGSIFRRHDEILEM